MDAALDQLHRQVRPAGAGRCRLAEKHCPETVGNQQIRIERRRNIQKRPKQLEIRLASYVFVSVVLHHARPVDVREQRRIFQAHHFHEFSRTQQDVVALLA